MELRDQVPFRPFRIVFTDGRTFTVPHRDFLYISKHKIELVMPDSASTGPPLKVVASPLHVVRVEGVEDIA
jgi:hypothetical protein